MLIVVVKLIKLLWQNLSSCIIWDSDQAWTNKNKFFLMLAPLS